MNAGCNGMTDIRPATPADHVALLALWLASVRATHAFLDEHDIQALIPIVRDDALPNLEVWVMQRKALVSGFIGLSGAHVEALFVAPECFRQGCGQALLAHARQLKGMLTVDVNEQNPQALAFYIANGFKVQGRSPIDASGNPFPLLHLREIPSVTAL
jgi:putative acetyltransferase